MAITLKKESDEQIKIVHWIKSCTNLPVYATINEGKRGWFNASILKKMGLRSGVSDLFIPRAIDGYHGCFLEIKVGKGKLSPMQAIFLEDMINENYFASAVWGSDSAIQIIKNLYKIQ
jgi:hypothetical protein